MKPGVPGAAGALDLETDAAGAVILSVRVAPRAAREAIAGTRGGALLVRLTAPPVDGKANAALVRLLSRLLGLPRSGIEILAGASARTKRLRLVGTTAEAVGSLALAAAEQGVDTGSLSRRRPRRTGLV